MPSNRPIRDSKTLSYVNTRYTIQREPFNRLLRIVNHSISKFRKPALFKVVIYLGKSETNISRAMEELTRLYSEGGAEFLYHWSKEYKVDSKHSGLHWHLVFIGEARTYEGREFYVRSRLRHCLSRLQESGLVNNFSFSDPWSENMKPNNLKPCVADQSRAIDLVNWLSYDCKAESKEEVQGRCYGCSRIPSDVEPLALWKLGQKLAA